MSLDCINKSETTVKMIDGVKIWSNPSVSVTIDSLGRVFNKDGSLAKKHTNKTHPMRVKFGSKTIRWTASYTSLFARMVLGVKLANKTLRLKDKSKGWDSDNVEFVKTHGESQKKDFVVVKNIDIDNLKRVVEHDSATIENHKNIHYTVTKGLSSWVTEDGAVFPTEELAKWHQNRVSKGKGNAQVVLDYNGGYILAEQIYFQEVVYNKKKPYVNFSDVMSNNNGVVSDTKDDEYKFTTRNIPSDLIYRTTLSFERLNNFVCGDKEYATKLNNKINSVVLVYKSFVDVSEDIVNLIK